MDIYRISVSDLAKQDIKDVATHITYELQEPAIAMKTTNAILDAIFTLEEMPERIGYVKDERLAGKGVRPLYVNNYTIFFRIEESERVVDIVRVMYSRRNWATLL